jgi:hypothetical protein
VYILNILKFYVRYIVTILQVYPSYFIILAKSITNENYYYFNYFYTILFTSINRLVILKIMFNNNFDYNFKITLFHYIINDDDDIYMKMDQVAQIVIIYGLLTTNC